MEDLAPQITRQRLVIEGFFEREVKQETIVEFFQQLTKELELRTYGEPTIHMTGGEGKEANQGFDAFIPLIDSGIALYVWSNARFFSTVIYTCKRFDTKKAVKVVKDFFKAKKVAFESF